METIVVAGAVAQKPQRGGHTWVFLQYLLGLRRLGWDVLFVDQLEPGMCADAAGRPCAIEHSLNLIYFREQMSRFALQGAFALLDERGNSVIGLSRPEVMNRTRRAAMLLNVNGYLTEEEILSAAPRRVFLDIDPGVGQIWTEQGLAQPFKGHDAFVTVGMNVGNPGCQVPSCGLDWISTPPPVVLEWWPPDRHQGGFFSTVASWRGAYGGLQNGNRTYGQRAHEFRKFVSLPRLTGNVFEIALDIHPAETRDLELLAANGWRTLDPLAAARDPLGYRSFIQSSKAEFMVAKNLYVESCGGWFSDRSACYLASGKPVVAQDTAIRDVYPTGRGLLVYTTLEEAADAVNEVTRDYERHSRAARQLAEEYFDSDKVLRRLLGRLGCG